MEGGPKTEAVIGLSACDVLNLFPQIQTMVESLKLSITDQQLPMIIRILELIIALYYGEIGGHKEGDGEEHGGAIKETGAALSGESETSWSWICSFCQNVRLSRHNHLALTAVG